LADGGSARIACHYSLYQQVGYLYGLKVVFVVRCTYEGPKNQS
jgi:hypothetical protein